MTTTELCACGNVIDGSRTLAARHFTACSKCRSKLRRKGTVTRRLNAGRVLVDTRKIAFRDVEVKMNELDSWLDAGYRTPELAREIASMGSDPWKWQQLRQWLQTLQEAGLMTVKSDPRNVGKRVRYTFKRGAQRFDREATIVRFRGGRLAHAAYIAYRTPSGSYRQVSVQLKCLEYV